MHMDINIGYHQKFMIVSGGGYWKDDGDHAFDFDVHFCVKQVKQLAHYTYKVFTKIRDYIILQTRKMQSPHTS